MKDLSITIITVCLNAQSIIKQTIDSVLSQKNIKFEYLIWDGGSTDKTLETADNYRQLFEETEIDYIIHTGTDSGIYDAMNKAADIAKGDWILYLNAGDYLYSGDCLSKLAESVNDDIDVLYGDVLYTYYSLYKPFISRPAEAITQEYIFCHQSVLTRKEVIRHYKFDLRYLICSDYDMYLRSYLNGCRFCHTNIPVCVYDNNGFSSKGFYLDSHIERATILYNNRLITHKEYESGVFKEKLFRVVPGFFERILPFNLVRVLITPLLLIKGWKKNYIEYRDFYKT